MSVFTYRQAIFWGFVTYSAVFFLWSLLSSYGLSHGLVAQILGYIVTFGAVWGASSTIGISMFSDAIKYGLGFAIVHIVLDALVILPSIGITAFFSMFVWIGYSIVLLTPIPAMLYIRFRFHNPTQSIN